jgi:(E)-4-hydroxy-3-methylbut-2-enyl-diphosphate synthase
VNGPGEALMTDIGFTGGGSGKGVGMVYLAGKVDHKIDNTDMVEHIAGLVEAKAAEFEAKKAAEEAAKPARETVPAE